MAIRTRRFPEAESDLDDIWLHIARDNLAAADAFIDRLDAAELKLSDMPAIGRPREELGKGLRSWPVGDYLLFYHAEPDALVIVRVLHGARDIPAEFDDG